MNLQGGSTNLLQGGGNIQIGGYSPQPQPSQTPQLQPAIDVNTWTPTSTLGASTYAAPVLAPAPAPVYRDSLGNTYGSQAQANVANQTISQTNAALDRLPGQLDVGYRNIESGYNSALNQLNQAKATAQSGYDTGKTQQTQDFVGTKNTIGSNAGNSLNGLLRLLGSRGAGGSSAALYSAPTAVGTQAAQQRAGAGQTFGRNQQALDTNFNNFLTGWDNSLTDVGRQRDNSKNSLQAQIDTTRAGLLNTLAGLQNNPDAVQNYLNQSNSLLSQADQLGLQTPVYQVQPTVYNAPNLDAYTTNPFATPQSHSNALTDAVTPFTSLLFAGQRDKQPNLQGAF